MVRAEEVPFDKLGLAVRRPVQIGRAHSWRVCSQGLHDKEGWAEVGARAGNKVKGLG